jgi:hypothetical protein
VNCVNCGAPWEAHSCSYCGTLSEPGRRTLVSPKVNMEDVLSARPGGIVRVDSLADEIDQLICDISGVTRHSRGRA